MKQIDVTNQLFGKLTAKKYIGNSLWECLCTCGGTTLVRLAELRGGMRTGCNKCKGRLSEKGLAGINILFTKYKRRGLSPSISKDKFKQLTSSNCHYCFSPPKCVVFSRNRNLSKDSLIFGSYKYNGLDKKDPNKGYTEENIVPCCKICNFAKRRMQYDEFIAYIDVLANRRFVNEFKN